MALDEVKGLQGASDRPDDRDFHAEHILGAEPVEIPKYVNLNDLVPSHNQGASLHCTSYGLTHCIEILNTLEHNMKIVLNPEEQWQNQLNPPNEPALLPPADESVGDSLQHALRIFMRFGLKNEKNAVAVDRFQGLGYAAIQKTLEDYKRWITLKYPVYSGWLSHCFAIVGFDDAKQVLICKNSYGPNWGENRDGSFTIDYADIPRLFTGYIIYDKSDKNMIFKDVSENSPMAKSIKRLRDEGFVRGYSNAEKPEDRLFMPDKPVTRAEVCEIISNLMDKLANDN